MRFYNVLRLKLTKFCIHVNIILLPINIEEGKFGIKQVVFVVFCYKSTSSIVHYICIVKTEIFTAFVTRL